MSQNISMPAARVPLVDERGQITREWMQWFIGIFQRAGGVQGLSNQELSGEAAGAQDYNKLLSRLGAAEAAARGSATTDAALQDLQQRLSQLEALSREMSNAMQILWSGGMQPPASPQASPAPRPTNVFDTITVKGEANLSTESGATKVAGGVTGSTANFQVGGDAQVSGSVEAGGNVNADGGFTTTTNINAQGRLDIIGPITTYDYYWVGGDYVVGPRISGIPYYPGYGGQTLGPTYDQSMAQTSENALRDVATAVSKLNVAMRSHGLVGD